LRKRVLEHIGTRHDIEAGIRGHPINRVAELLPWNLLDKLVPAAPSVP
jgi:hypothetical protein